jgi:hypothetical protein
MIVNKNSPIKTIRFVPIEEESVWGGNKSYLFKCRAELNYETETIDIDMVFDTEEERREYEEFEQSKKNGVEYYSEIPDL